MRAKRRVEATAGKERCDENRKRQDNGTTPDLTAQEFAHLGDGSLAYVKTIDSEDVARLFPQAPPMQPGLTLFALLGADGSPIMLTNSKDAAIANAWEHELETVSLH